jgi:sugar O-acyltransferase (sialic acid O-acetyltransferase NeuD family)
MPQPLAILGTGGNALDLLDIVEALNRVRPTWSVVGFFDDARPAGTEYRGVPILGSLRDVSLLTGARFINAIGSDRSYRLRTQIIEATGLPRERFATLVHPGAAVSSNASLGNGVYLNHGACVGGGVVIEDHVALGAGCLIGHDARLAAYSILAHGAAVSGFARVGRGCYLGANCSIRQRLCIGDGALVGMGAVVTRDVPPDCTVVGNPARRLKRPERAMVAHV